MSRGLTIVSALLTLACPVTARAGAEPVAVVDLDADRTVGLVPPKPEEVQALTDQLRAELSATGRFVVIEPARVARALAEQGVTGADCRDACLVTLGRSLDATKVVTGRVVRMMTLLWGVDLRVTDVATGVQAGGVGEFKGDYLVLKTLGIRQLVRQMAGAARAAGPSADDVRARLAAASVDRPPDFAGQDLSGLDLEGLDFKRANLRGANLEDARLARADLFATDLAGARLARADLTGANLNVAVLRGADLQRARLGGASLFAVVATGADFSDADLQGARIIAELSNARLVRANLKGANLGADRGNQPMGLMRTVLAGADLSSADLSGADASKAEMPRANLTSANLRGADLTLVDFSGADVAAADFRSARGVKQARGLDTARNLDQAKFD